MPSISNIFNGFRMKLLSCVDRAINPESYMNEVVYDLDLLCAVPTTEAGAQRRYLSFVESSYSFGNIYSYLMSE